jgi:hypothetical protein
MTDQLTPRETEREGSTPWGFGRSRGADDDRRAETAEDLHDTTDTDVRDASTEGGSPGEERPADVDASVDSETLTETPTKTSAETPTDADATAEAQRDEAERTEDGYAGGSFGDRETAADTDDTADTHDTHDAVDGVDTHDTVDEVDTHDAADGVDTHDAVDEVDTHDTADTVDADRTEAAHDADLRHGGDRDEDAVVLHDDRDPDEVRDVAAGTGIDTAPAEEETPHDAVGIPEAPIEAVPAGAAQPVHDEATATPPTGLKPGAAPNAPVVAAFWKDSDAQAIRDRWRELQLRFIDDPESVAGEAEHLVEEAVHQLTAALNEARTGLGRWHDQHGGDTEQLRAAVRGYRDFLDRVLGL